MSSITITIPACGGCCLVVDCCMYAWPDSGGSAYYPETDLPDAVEYAGEVLTHDAGLFKFTGATYYIIEGATQWELRLVSDDSLVSSFDCLIGGNGVTDQFASSYIADIPLISVTVEVVRISLCTWQYINGDTVVTLSYGRFGLDYEWYLQGSDGVTDTTGTTADQSSPVGSYSFGASVA